MKEKFMHWKPNSASRAKLETIGTVIKEHHAENIVMTLRQLFYQLVSKNIIENTQREYKNLGEFLSKARLAGLVDWAAIEDRMRQAVVWREFEDIQECVDEAAREFTLPRWADQPVYLELWCEKDALSSVLEPVCDELFTTFMVNRGYTSSSAMYKTRDRIKYKRVSEDGEVRDVHIIYLGDLDPSGEDMVRDIRDRFDLFGIKDVKITKLALNPSQVSKWKLPPNPAKMTDSRAAGYIRKHGTRKSYEVDAIPPKDLQKMVRRTIMNHMDMDLYQAVMDRETVLRNKLIKAVAKIK